MSILNKIASCLSIASGHHLHWSPSGRFEVSAVGTSFYRDAIASIAENPADKPALVYCMVTLVPEPENQNDSSAVSIWIEGRKVAHLSRDYARVFIVKLPHSETQVTTCDAIIYNGGIFDGKVYEYTIQLDLPYKHWANLSEISPTYTLPVRKNGDTDFIKQDDGAFLISAFLPNLTSECLDKDFRVQSWTTDHWTTINYYLLNRQGIGLGFGAFRIPKERHQMMFGDQEPHVFVKSIEGCLWTFLIKNSPTEEDFANYQKPYLNPEDMAWHDHIAAIQSKSVIYVVILEVNEEQRCFSALRYEVQIPSGKPIQLLSEIKDDLYQLETLIKDADLVVALDSKECLEFAKKALPAQLDLMPKKWREAGKIWLSTQSETLRNRLQSVATPSNGLDLCRQIAENLFQHSGKTTRSKTYIGHLVKASPAT